MPGISPINILGNLKFFMAGLKLPSAGSSGGAEKWSEKYFKDRDKAEMTGKPELIPPWFLPQKPGYVPHQKACDTVGKDFKDFHDAMLDAVKFAHDLWKMQAKFDGLHIMALAAIGAPGCLKGPELESDIQKAPQVAGFKGNMAKHRDAVAKGVSQCFKKWQDNVMVPGLPWYPAFVAFPGPTAPPMPNLPMPLITCVSPMMTEILLPSAMTAAMDDALDGSIKDKDPDKQYHALHDAIATVLSISFLIWLVSQMVTNVMGKGPIPTFAPPFVPVGPVMGGDNIAIAGHLIA